MTTAAGTSKSRMQRIQACDADFSGNATIRSRVSSLDGTESQTDCCTTATAISPREQKRMDSNPPDREEKPGLFSPDQRRCSTRSCATVEINV
jgi:hypothetical protein